MEGLVFCLQNTEGVSLLPLVARPALSAEGRRWQGGLPMFLCKRIDIEPKGCKHN